MDWLVDLESTCSALGTADGKEYVRDEQCEEGVKDLIRRLTDGDGSHLSAVIDSSCEGVDLTDGEPGQGGEHEVEQVLSDVDHDVVVLEDALFDDITRNNCKSAPSNVVKVKYVPTYRSQVHQLPRLARKLLGASRIPLASLSAS